MEGEGGPQGGGDPAAQQLPAVVQPQGDVPGAAPVHPVAAAADPVPPDVAQHEVDPAAQQPPPVIQQPAAINPPQNPQPLVAPVGLQARGLPLSRQATIAFLKSATDASVMGLVTLNAFFATYLLAWGPAGSKCIPSAPAPSAPTPSAPAPSPGPSALMDSDKHANPSLVQVLVAALPFLVFPLTLFVSGLVQAAERDGHALGFVATMCLIEFVGAIALGAGMAVCMSGWSWVWYVAGLIIVLMVLGWGATIKHPERLRRFIWSTIFRRDEIVHQA